MNSTYSILYTFLFHECIIQFCLTKGKKGEICWHYYLSVSKCTWIRPKFWGWEWLDREGGYSGLSDGGRERPSIHPWQPYNMPWEQYFCSISPLPWCVSVSHHPLIKLICQTKAQSDATYTLLSWNSVCLSVCQNSEKRLRNLSLLLGVSEHPPCHLILRDR